jgi:hypothetical protein
MSGLEVHKNTCLCFSTLKLYAIYVFNSAQNFMHIRTLQCEHRL